MSTKRRVHGICFAGLLYVVDWLVEFIFSYMQSFIHNLQNGSDDITASNLMQLYTKKIMIYLTY